MAENPREDLAESACLELLSGHHFGRVAFIEQADEPPAIMPVNYLMHGETVVFRTDPNSKLGRAVRSTVCLRIRQHHQITGSGKLIKK